MNKFLLTVYIFALINICTCVLPDAFNAHENHSIFADGGSKPGKDSPMEFKHSDSTRDAVFPSFHIGVKPTITSANTTTKPTITSPDHTMSKSTITSGGSTIGKDTVPAGDARLRARR
jgi:hypothetical protein